jgi:hypothetical protein
MVFHLSINGFAVRLAPARVTRRFAVRRGAALPRSGWKTATYCPAAAQDTAALERTVAALPAEQQVKAVAARLKDLNPGFDGKVTPTRTAAAARW